MKTVVLACAVAVGAALGAVLALSFSLAEVFGQKPAAPTADEQAIRNTLHNIICVVKEPQNVSAVASVCSTIWRWL